MLFIKVILESSASLTNIGSINFVAWGIKQSHIHKVCSSLLYPHCFAFLLPLFVKMFFMVEIEIGFIKTQIRIFFGFFSKVSSASLTKIGSINFVAGGIMQSHM